MSELDLKAFADQQDRVRALVTSARWSEELQYKNPKLHLVRVIWFDEKLWAIIIRGAIGYTLIHYRRSRRNWVWTGTELSNGSLLTPEKPPFGSDGVSKAGKQTRLQAFAYFELLNESLTKVETDATI